jgi:hypothetical protein
VTLLIAPLIGIASALLTILLTPSLQHYFWRRQRYAERQFAVIEEVRTLAAELQFLVLHQPEEISTRREQLYTMYYKVTTSVNNLFSDAAWDQFHPASSTMEDILRGAPLPEQNTQLSNRLITTMLDALDALYQDMGIPPTPLKQRRGAQARTRIRRS